MRETLVHGDWLSDSDIIAEYGDSSWFRPRRYFCVDRMCGADDCSNCHPDQEEEPDDEC